MARCGRGMAMQTIYSRFTWIFSIAIALWIHSKAAIRNEILIQENPSYLVECVDDWCISGADLCVVNFGIYSCYFSFFFRIMMHIALLLTSNEVHQNDIGIETTLTNEDAHNEQHWMATESHGSREPVVLALMFDCGWRHNNFRWDFNSFNSILTKQ